MIVDYNQMFGTDYSTDTWDRYFSDVSKKMKQAQIDILLVVNMFLTGFDSKPLNTLYVDKNLQYHNLLQAYSRTNRVEKATKPYGNVVCYRNLKDQTDDTIRLFSKTDSVDDVLMQNYDAYLAKFKEALEGLKKVAASPEQVDALQTEEDQREFIVAFKNVTKMLQRLQSFSDFEFDEDELKITEQSYEDYKSKYFKIHDRLKKEDPRKESILQDIDFEIELMHTDRINVSYIMNLIANLTMDDEKTRDQEIKLIKQELDHASDEKLRLKVELIHNFLDKIVPQLGTNVSILDEYSKYEEEVQEEEMNTFASEVGLEQSVLKEQVATYEYANIIEDSTIMDRLSGSFLKKNKAIKAIKSFIHEQVAKYGA